MLKPDRLVVRSTSWHITDVVGEPGMCMAFKTNPTGNGKNGSQGVASTFANASGKQPAGMLLTPVVADNGRTMPNINTGEVYLGNPVELMTEGYAWTDQIEGSPTYGQDAYQGPSGLYTADAAYGSHRVGKFGEVWGTYRKVEIDING